jgi:hypothetical protein
MQNSFKQTQYQFAAHIRDPKHQPAPGNIEDRRMAIYRDLFYNNINGTLKNAFPVIHTLMNEADWEAMVRDFMIQHRSKTPLFVEIAREFIAYLENEREVKSDPPFMQELAHYEWVELALTIAEPDFKKTPLAEDDDVLALHFVQSPLAWLLIYQYPVHQISAENQPQAAAETPICLLVYRNQAEQIKFIELNPVSARLLELLAQGQTGHEAVDGLATAMQHPDPQVVANGAIGMINDWVERGILLKQQA